ncbi:DNA-binding WRKY domain-containing protein [Pochonia chlamydosporia 170]|uniref:DNA-binding WRKY domain-containing protein n=1 Tax=Pochonia chlamydosporia 170 TaxID=1380566 RepID=A0A219AR83_METCM|nr:DNA-binding WRKY domain-containing protein [Pochonia chlamydosporia 170]OWT42685.1 DNA-binding WRKY domain-containing protein [Pochonia chlamydosporia 170]
MDGVFDDSPWRYVIPIIDYADRACHGNFGLLLTLIFVLVYYALLGGGLGLLLQTFFVGLQYHHTLQEIVLSFGHSLYGIIISVAGAVGIAVFAISHFFRPGVTLEGPARPFLVPCKTTHVRLFPKKHSFGYSYLVVGVPVGSKGNFNGMLAIDDRFNGFWSFMCRLVRGGWYTVNASDYLQRGISSDGLRGKLDEYLQSQVRALNHPTFPMPT